MIAIAISCDEGVEMRDAGAITAGERMGIGSPAADDEPNRP
jgi:hypothetical protein